MASALLCAGVTTTYASNDTDWWSMGPVGGTFQVQSGQAYIAVRSVEAGSPADLAGLQAGDYITGAFGKTFPATGGSTEGYKGAPQGFAQAIERAEAGDGQMLITVLRPSVGSVDLTVSLPVAGAFGAAYPLGSSKFDAMYQSAATQIHDSVNGGNGDIGYMTGFYGMILLADPNWAETTGAKPYRLSIDKMRDVCAAVVNSAIANPVEDTNLDGTPNDGSINDSDPNDQNYVGNGLENWTLSVHAMFLAEYRKKTGDTSVDAVVQLAADCLAARIQTWQQPPYAGSDGPTKYGLMGHGGVTADYPHISYAGMNIINSHAMTALAMLKEAGAAVNDTKMQASWEWVKSCTLLNGGSDDGNVGYGWQQGGYDSGGRTAGVAFSMASYGGLDSADELVLGRMKDYVTRQWQRMQHTHAYTAGGIQLYQFVLPYLPDRDQRFIMENQRMFYHFHRKVDGSLTWFGGRENNGGDGYVGTHAVALTSVGMAQAVASGNLTTIAPIDSTRIHAEFTSPFLTWPTLEARRVEIDTLSQVFTVGVTDSQGADLLPADYTATWSHVSGPAAATFTSPNTAGTTVNFPQDGTYRIQLVTVKGGYTLTEPIDVVVDTSVTPAGYVFGQVRQRIYSDISGTEVSDLTSSPKFPDSPDATGTLSSIDSASVGDSLGQRINGYIVPETTGSYTFYVAGDDAAEFRINSTGTDPAAATTVCSVGSWTNQYEWTKQTSQTSAAISLTAGQMYYFEALHKEAGGGDNVAVAWTGPGIATPTVISGNVLATTDGVSLVKQPTAQSASLGGTVSFSVAVEGDGPFLYEWSSGATSFGVGSSSTLTLENIGAGHAGDYSCVVTYPGGALTSSTASLSINDAGILASGGLWRDQFDGIGGNAVTDLTGNSNYPRFPSSGGEVSTAEDVGGEFDSYGARWTGWVRPDVTGTYYFYIASDDHSELWLSTDDQPSNKVNVASLSGAISARAWSSGGQSVGVNLVAGERYYIEVLHKEGGGGDHCAVAWRKPGEAVPANGSAPIAGQYLEYFTGGVQDPTIVIPPNFNSSYDLSIAENVGGGVSVGTILATDDSGNTPITYSITGGNTGGMFAINATTGEIITAGDPDYESLSSYTLQINATNSVGAIGQTLVNIAVLNRLDGAGSWAIGVDEGTPALLKYTAGLAGNTTTTVDLSGISGDATYEFLVDGEDNGQSSTTLLTANGWHLRMEQWNNTNQLGVTQSGVADWQLTAESGQSTATPYGSQTHIVYVVDSAAVQTRVYVNSVLVGTLNRAPDLANVATILGDTGLRNDAESGILGFAAYNSALDVTEITDHYDDWRGDVPNYAPVATDVVFAIDEGQPSGTVLGSVVATDSNAGDALSYAITSGDPSNDFTIDASTGQLTTADALNYDLATQYVLSVTVTDINGLTDVASVTVNVGNLPGGVSDWVAQVDTGSTFLHKRTTSVPGNSFVTVDLSAITGDATYEFVVGSVNFGQSYGNLLAANGWQLRNEQWDNSNELGATLSGNADWSLTAESGQSVATPYDRVAHITYVVDSVAGELRAYVDGVLVGKLNQQPNLSNVAVQLGSPELRNDSEPGIIAFAAYNSALDAAEIALHSGAWYGSVSNTAPVADDATFALAENANTGTAVGTVIATDAGDTLTYAITAGNAGGEFAINASTGEITTVGAFDYETTSQYVLTVSATDTGALSDTATITVNVTNVNEAIAASDNSGTLAEDATIVSAAATVTTSDPDAGDSVSFAITGGNTGNAFAIDTNGNITTATALDFETTPSYSLTVTATDGGGLSDTATVTVTVTNVNEAIVANDNSGTLAESAAIGSAVAIVTTTDPDAGDSVSFAITGGNTGNAFAIDTNGNITTATGLNYEASPSYSLIVTATDGGGLSDTATVTVTVTNVNEAIVANDNSGTLAEDATIGSAVATVTTSDPDAGDSVSFAITSGNTGNAFAIDANGNITSATALDFETTPSYSLTVTATDGGGLSDTATVTVTVANVNEAIVANDNSGTLAESAAIGSAVATVTTSDPDAGDSVSFAITGGNTGNAFAIDTNGNITSATALDFETTPSYSLTVTATDGGGLSDTATVTVTVTDVAEGPADSDGDGVTDAVEIALGTDPNLASSTPGTHYSGLVGWWGLEEASGVIAADTSGHAHDGSVTGATVVAGVDGNARDFSGTSQYVNLGNSATMDVTGTITMAAWIKPEATNSYRNIISHGHAISPDGEVVLRITDGAYQVGSWNGANAMASAGDANADLNTWVHIAGVYDGTHWRIYRNGVEIGNTASAQGAVSVADDWAIGARGTGTERFFDGAIDDARLYDRALSAVEVASLHDELTNHAPVANDATLALAEDAAASSVVGTVVATDAGDTLTYAITAGNAGGEFAINASTGEITTVGAFDYETTSQYVLTVSATDTGALSDTATITVNVTNVNEAIAASDNSGTLAEDATIVSAAATVTTSDPDAGDSVSFAITGGNTGNAFAIDTNGNITTATALDFETTPSYSLTVTATDGGGLSDTATVTVTVTNVNEAIVANDNSGTLAESAAIGSAVAIVTTTDPDAGDSVSFAITGGNTGNAFAIDTNGNITTATGLNYEASPSYSLIVTATDGGGLSNSATVTVTVTNVNEAIVANDTSGTLAEDAIVGSAVATVTTSDPDAGDSVSFAITGGNTGNAFAIDTNGNITSATSLDFETTPSYSLTVTATDGSGLSDTATVTVTITDVVETTAPVVATGSASNLETTTADIGYSITDDGGEAPSVTLYYGETDGGTTPGSWTNNVAVGAKATGAYVESLTGLTEGTSYYFTIAATNSIGTTWGSTGSFDTTADSTPKMVRTTVNAVSSTNWTTVDLGQNYTSAVIVATPIYADSTQVPVVTRIRNVSGSSFDLKLDRADGLTAETTCGVSVIAVEEGVYTLAADGVQMEAVKFTSTITGNRSSWNAEARTYQNSYTTPVVVGQVMSANDANWSTFWSMGSTRLNPADASNLNVGKHVAEDTNTTRANETIGYIVIESGSGTINGVAYTAAVGSDIVRNYENSASGYSYSLTGLTSASAAALSSAGMDGADGAWPVLNGVDALSSTAVKLIVDEDQFKDSERKHATEQINYIIFE